MIPPFRVRESKSIFQKDWFNIRQDSLEKEGGVSYDYPIAEIKPVSCVLGIDSENHIILQHEYRPTSRKTVIELSCGGLDEKEDPKVAAAREFKEETGFEVGSLEKVGVWNTLTGKCVVDMHMFIGRVSSLKPTAQKLDPFEIIEPFRVPAKEAVQMVLDGRIVNAEHVALILVAKEKHPEWFA